MSIQCDNTTAIASGFSSMSVPIGGGIGDGLIDLSALLAEADPLDSVQIDRKTAVAITDGLNNLVLATTNLDAFPTLKERFGQFPLTYTEVAGYMLDNNVNGDNVLDSISKYDSTLGPEVTLTNTLSDLDLFYNLNYGASISGGLCGAFGNTLLELIGLFTLIDATATKLANLDIKNLDPMKLATALAEKLKLKAIKDKLLEIIDKLIEKIKKKVGDAIDSAISTVKGFVGDPKGTLLKHLSKIRTEVEEFFSSETVERIRQNVEAFIAEMVAMFETPTIANVQLMMYKLCSFTETITAILFGPADEVAEIAKTAEKESVVINTVEKLEQQKAVKAGGIRVEKEVAEEIKEKSAESINQAANDNNPNRYIEKVSVQTKRGTRVEKVVKYRQPGELGYIDPSSGNLSIPTNVDYITSSKLTDQEIDAIDKIDENGFGPTRLITFSDAVVRGKQWKGIDNSVLAKLLRLSQLSGEKYELRQGCVIAVTNRYSAQEYTKVKKQGASMYHHKYSGFAVELNVEDSIRDKTIIAASRAGFTGISVGKTYLRLHLGARDGAVATQNNTRWKKEERFDDTQATHYDTMMKKHRVDGYRKKREAEENFRFFDKATHKQQENNDGTFSFVDNNSILGVNSQEEQPFSLLRPTD